MGPMRRFPEWPLLLAGCALALPLAVVRSTGDGGGIAPRPAIVVTRAAVERLREARRRESGPAVPPPSERALVDAVVEEEILWRAGRALVDDGGDPVVRRRVEALRVELAAGRTGEPDAADPPAGGAASVAGSQDAIARTDLVLRRYLVEAARLALAGQAAGPPPSDAQVDAWTAASDGRFARPARLRFEHVFLARDRHGAGLGDAAAAMLVALASGSSGATAPVDPFPAGSSFTGTPAEVDRAFGPGFAGRVASLPKGAWSGPVPSPFGLHLVRLTEASGPGPARPSAVRSRAALALRRDAQVGRLRERLAALRERYDVTFEDGLATSRGVAGKSLPAGAVAPGSTGS